MLIEQVFEFQLKGSGPPGRKYALQLIIFITKQNNDVQGKFSSGIVFTKILQEVMYLTSPTWAKSLIKFNTKMQYFYLVLDLNCK